MKLADVYIFHIPRLESVDRLGNVDVVECRFLVDSSLTAVIMMYPEFVL